MKKSEIAVDFFAGNKQKKSVNWTVECVDMRIITVLIVISKE